MFIVNNNFSLKFVEPDGDHILLKDKYISTTRSYNLKWAGGDIRLTLDGDKLKNNYRIKPMHYFNIINRILLGKFKKTYDLRDFSNIEEKNKRFEQYCKNYYDTNLNQFEERILYSGRGCDNIKLEKYLLRLDTNNESVYNNFKNKFSNIDFNYVKEYEIY